MSLSKATTLLLDHARKSRPRGRSASAIGPTTDRNETRFALSYLDAFGYLKEGLAGWKDVKLEDLIAGVKKFHEVFGIAKATGLCAKTIKAMEAPRCGCPDIVRPRHAGYAAAKAFAANMLPAWRKRGLTYAITDYLPGLSRPDQDATTASCFAAWTRYCNVEAQQVRDESAADILISTGEGPRSNFDGPGGTLAWAYMPDGNDQQLVMKFDLGETWVLGPNERGIILPNVETHEIGHLLGMDHSRKQGALMAAYYSAAIGVPQMDDDIPRAQARYGVRDGQSPTTPPAYRKLVVDMAQGTVVSIDGRQIT